MTCLETGVITACFLLGNEQPGCDLQGSPVRRGSYPSIVVPTGTEQRVESPLERPPSMISTDRPEIESWPHEFLLQVMDREAWHAVIHGIAKSRIERLN